MLLNQVNPKLQLTMERRTTNLPFLEIMINKTLEQKFDGYIQQVKKMCAFYIKSHTKLPQKYPISFD